MDNILEILKETYLIDNLLRLSKMPLNLACTDLARASKRISKNGKLKEEN